MKSKGVNGTLISVWRNLYSLPENKTTHFKTTTRTNQGAVLLSSLLFIMLIDVISEKVNTEKINSFVVEKFRMALLKWWPYIFQFCNNQGTPVKDRNMEKRSKY